MAAEGARQAPLVTLEDVAVSFSPAEWALLTERQRRLYRDVMEEARELVASFLEPLPSRPEPMCRTEQGEAPSATGPCLPGERSAQGSPTSADQSRSDMQKQEIKVEPGSRSGSPSPSLPRSAPGSNFPPLEVCPRWCEVKLTDLRSPSWGRLSEGAWGPVKEELLICGECGVSCSAWESLGEHRRLHWAERGPFACSVCGKAFRHRSNLLAHKKHRRKRRHACAQCGLQFCLRGDLLRHRASHAAEGTFPCGTCSQVFPNKRHLLAHRREHARKGPEKCPDCGEAVGGEAELLRHRAAHAGDRPFTCATCGKSFCWKESLQIHQQQLHVQGGGFPCSLCGRTFSRHGNLLAHQRQHTGELPFACPECERRFATKANLTVHCRLHRSGPRALACLPCGRAFRSREKLLEHQASHVLGEKGVPVKEEP
ncbi:uncharacterized protein LOC110082593 [Pogona vitticeps]